MNEEKAVHNTVPPLFVGGTGRSGTTILAKTLGQHPQITFIPWELRFLVDPDGLIDLVDALTTKWSPYHADHAVRRFARLMQRIGRRENIAHKVFRRLLTRLSLGAPPPYLRVPGGAYVGERNWTNAVNRFCDTLIDSEFPGYWFGTERLIFGRPTIYGIAKKDIEHLLPAARSFVFDLLSPRISTSDTRWIDHTPYSILHTSFLLRLFPNAKFIHVTRDPRDIVASYKTKTWGGTNAAEIVPRLYSILSIAKEAAETLPSDRLLHVRLESLIESPMQNLENIAEFLGAEALWKPAEIDLSQGHVGRWKKDLSGEEQRFIQDSLSELAAYFGCDL